MPDLPVLSRILYGAELLAVSPVILALALLALMLGLYSAGAFLVSVLSSLLTWEKVSVQMTVFGALGLALSGSGLVALYDFLSVSAAYLRRGPSLLALRRRQFFRGLGLSAMPLLFTTFVTVQSIPDERSLMMAIFYASGMVLLIPAFHLGTVLWRGHFGSFHDEANQPSAGNPRCGNRDADGKWPH